MIDYPIAITKAGKNYGVVVPDVVGCFPMGDSINDTIEQTEALLYEHIACLLELKKPFTFKASHIDTLKSDLEYKDAIWAIVSIDESLF